MKISIRKIIIIMLIFILIEIVYLWGFYTPNKESYSNSETEICEEVCAEIPTEISVSDSDFKNEISICEDDLTSEDDCVIIIEENEPTVEDVIMNECGLAVIDYVALIDSYEDGNWYAYYIYSDGDCYVITLKNNHVDVCCQLN